MPPDRFETKIMVRETRQIHSGTTKTGGQYTIWQLIATKPDGSEIPFNLRSFYDLPKNEILEVECELFKSEQYGDSYTVTRKGGSTSARVEKEMKQLVTRVERLETELAALKAGPQSGTSPPPAPPGTPPPPPATVQPDPTEGDVPF